MSLTFSFSRLGKLIAKQFFENSRFYLFCVLAMVGLLALVFAFWFASGPNYYEQVTYIIFLFGLFISGTVFAGLSFNMLGSKDKGIYWLSLPATHLEKLACTILYSIIGFSLVYCLCFFTIKSLSVVILTEYIKEHPGSSYREMHDFTRGFGGAVKYFICAYVGVQSLYLLGSVYFSRYSFIITTVVVAAFIFSFGYYLTRIEHNMISPADWNLVNVRKFDRSANGGYFLYSLSPAVTNTLKYAALFAWAPVFWLVTWFRLKEKEV